MAAPSTTNPVDQIAANIAVVFLGGKARATLVKAMAIPSDEKPWKAYDRADRALWKNSLLGPNHGVGAAWDNRRKSSKEI